MERVVITGMGTINSLGLDTEESWRNVVKGVSGVGPITQFDASDLLVRIACEARGFDPCRYMEPREARRRDRFEQMGLVAAKQALSQSGFEINRAPDRVGVIISSATGGLATLQSGMDALRDQGPRRLSPFLIPMYMPNGASGLVAIEFGAKGPCFSISSACASGADGIGAAWQLVRNRDLDAVLAGASEATICRLGVAAFDRLGAMSRHNEDYTTTPRPFDKNRDGLVMGEGAAVLVLESLSHAKNRGAEILAELAGYAASADAFHVTAPAEDGAGGALAIRRALEAARAVPEEVDYINAHGTATQLNDLSETRAIKAALGPTAYHIPVSSTKAMTGHMMGATGALEAIFCVLAIRDGVIPPTLHYETPDPDCDLDYVPNQAREKRVRLALSNSFGFGGHNAVLVIREFRP
ncbi:MAG: beta-ketoacyl-ACP synthase II [Anaerolineales bacterium]|jgi:beta-ketoacyl-acyl-carrier-protein synthase II